MYRQSLHEVAVEGTKNQTKMLLFYYNFTIFCFFFCFNYNRMTTMMTTMTLHVNKLDFECNYTGHSRKLRIKMNEYNIQQKKERKKKRKVKGID